MGDSALANVSKFWAKLIRTCYWSFSALALWERSHLMLFPPAGNALYSLFPPLYAVFFSDRKWGTERGKWLLFYFFFVTTVRGRGGLGSTVSYSFGVPLKFEQFMRCPAKRCIVASEEIHWMVHQGSTKPTCPDTPLSRYVTVQIRFQLTCFPSNFCPAAYPLPRAPSIQDPGILDLDKGPFVPIPPLPTDQVRRSYSENKIPVLGSSVPVLGVKLKRIFVI